MKDIVILACLLLSINAFSQIEDTGADTSRHTMYGIVSISEYYNVNCEMSEAKNYLLGKKTERIWAMNPEKYCLVDSALFVALKLNPENQQFYTGELFEVTEIAFKDTILEDIEVEFIDQKTFNWMAKHYDKVGDKSKKWIWVDKKIDKEKAPEKIKDKTKTK